MTFSPPKKSNPNALAKIRKKLGDTYKKSPISKADVSKITPPKDYGKRQSKNIVDLRDRKSKAFKVADAKGKLDFKAMNSSKMTETKSVKRSTDENTKNRNIFVNRQREKYGDLVGLRVKNVKL